MLMRCLIHTRTGVTQASGQKARRTLLKDSVKLKNKVTHLVKKGLLEPFVVTMTLDRPLQRSCLRFMKKERLLIGTPTLRVQPQMA